MLLSRFWYVVLGLLLGAAFFMLSMAQGMFNRAGDRARGEGLSSDSQVVSWYLKDDARMRSAQLVKFALDPVVSKTLTAANKSETKLSSDNQEKVRAALLKVHNDMDKTEAFDAVFAVDQHGRVVGHLGYPQANGMKDFELGGYPVVADALHGFVRDDTLVWGRIYRVVARPVQAESGAQPVGAIVGARVLDDRFARELSGRTGAAVAFYVGGSRTAAGVPEGFLKSNLDQIVGDLEALQGDATYQEKGRSGIREVGEVLNVQYTRLPGEAYALGAGYAVARETTRVDSPLGFFKLADDKDKASANTLLAAGLALVAVLVGLVLSYLEHTRPLAAFKKEASQLSEGKTDQLQPSRFRGAYRKIAAEINEGIDKVAATSGGQSRRATNLEDVLGELPAQPQMAAFSVPGSDAEPPSFPLNVPGPAAGPAPVAQPGPSPVALGEPPAPGLPQPPRRQPPAAPVMPSAAEDPEAEWRAVYEQFVAAKEECGESTNGFTYEKFRTTLVRNRDALISRHGVEHVKFAVHIKAGKAALKASPVKI